MYCWSLWAASRNPATAAAYLAAAAPLLNGARTSSFGSRVGRSSTCRLGLQSPAGSSGMSRPLGTTVWRYFQYCARMARLSWPPDSSTSPSACLAADA